LIHLNSRAGQLEKDQRVLGTGKLVPVAGCVIGNKGGRESDQKTPAPDKDGRV
jgi:hypothetical protein